MFNVSTSSGLSAPQIFFGVLVSVFVFSRGEIHLSFRFFLTVLADPDCAGGALDGARVASW